MYPVFSLLVSLLQGGYSVELHALPIVQGFGSQRGAEVPILLAYQLLHVLTNTVT